MTTTPERTSVRDLAVGDREATAARLIQSSVERSYDPDIDIDWNAPLDPGAEFHPEHLLSLYGTEVWEAMSDEQRRSLARLEIGWTSAQGILAEIGLMTLLLRVATMDPLSAHGQYALTELADECRHSTMFSRASEKYREPGDPVVPPVPESVMRIVRALGVVLPNSPVGWSGLLYIEDTLDKMQRETMKTESVLPLIRMINRIHVLEEARHMTYAREELVRSVQRAGGVGLAVNRYLIGLSAMLSSRFVMPSELYAAVGLDGKSAQRIALANPNRLSNLRRHADRYVKLIDSLGLIDGRYTIRLWQRSGLL